MRVLLTLQELEVNSYKSKNTFSSFYLLGEYGPGTYGATEEEQGRLIGKFNIPENSFNRPESPFSYKNSQIGKTRRPKNGQIIGVGTYYVAEHIASSSEITNGLDRKSEGSDLDKKAPVFYEDANLHEYHVGTGNKGASTTEYKAKIKEFLKNDDVAGAFILNSKEYGKIPEFESFYEMKGKAAEFENKKAEVSHDSFLNMLENNPKFQINIVDVKNKKAAPKIEDRQLKSDAKISVLKARYEAYNGNKQITNKAVLNRIVADAKQITGKSYSIEEIQKIGTPNADAA